MRWGPVRFIALVVGALSLRGEPVLAFDCVETLCSQITSCAEAYYKYEVCGHTKRSSDSDGIPCENVCGKDRSTYLARARAQWPAGLAFIEPSAPDSSFGLIPDAQAGEADAQGETAAFSCKGKRTCKQMLSCAEAKFYLEQCGVRGLDRDGDGRPCHSLCR